MLKHLFPIILVFSLLISFLLPVQATAPESFEDSIATQYDAFAASIYQENSANGTLDLFLEHGLYGKGTSLSMDETSPVAAAIFNTALFRHFLCKAISLGINRMDQMQQPSALVGSRQMLGWHDFGREYQLSGYIDNDTPTMDDDYPTETLIPYTIYDGPSNRNDDVLLLTAGSITCIVRLTVLETTFTQRSIHLGIIIKDSFSFDSDYGLAEENGFNTTFSKLLCVLGPLIGLKAYDWMIETGFDITVPNFCSHQADTYRWEQQGNQLTNVVTDTLCANPLTQKTLKVKNNTLLYYQMHRPLVLRHTLPWVLEFQMDAARGLALTGNSLGRYSHAPYFHKSPTDLYCVQASFQGMLKPNTQHTDWATYQLDRCGIPTEAYGLPASDYHTYRLENRLLPDGTNQVWLWVDGEEIGPMIHRTYYDQEVGQTEFLPEDPMWLSGKDFCFSYIFNKEVLYKDVPLAYLQVQLCADAASSPVLVKAIPAACDQPQTEHRRCLLCGAEETVEIGPALPHKEQFIPGKTPTCTESGLSEGIECPDCGQVLLAQETLASLGHQSESLPGKAPGCTESGITEGEVCGRCQTVLKAQQTIPALDHNYDGGKCTLCGAQDPTFLPGDVDSDRVVTYLDAIWILRASVGLETPESGLIAVADVDGDNAISYLDAISVLRISVGLK